MVCMFCDHLWATIVPGNPWLTYVGRLAFPIFSFLIVEGFYHTSNLKKYMGRLFIFALISEIPFNLMMGGSWFYPIHQNVLWTFLIALSLMVLHQRAKAKGTLLNILVGVLSVVLGYILGFITFVDFFGVGVLSVLLFYFVRGTRWYHLLLQVGLLYYLNAELLQGLFVEVRLGGVQFELVIQSLALLALIPIWLYNGKQGYYSKAFKWFKYAFYPLHMLVLSLLALF